MAPSEQPSRCPSGTPACDGCLWRVSVIFSYNSKAPGEMDVRKGQLAAGGSPTGLASEKGSGRQSRAHGGAHTGPAGPGSRPSLGNPQWTNWGSPMTLHGASMSLVHPPNTELSTLPEPLDHYGAGNPAAPGQAGAPGARAAGTSSTTTAPRTHCLPSLQLRKQPRPHAQDCSSSGVDTPDAQHATASQPDGACVEKGSLHCSFPPCSIFPLTI